MEAQESFSMWLAFNDNRKAWKGDADARERAMQAGMLSQLPTVPIATTFRGKQLLGADRAGVRWSRRDWANILEQAARLAEKGHNNCTPLDQWVWWCYPVFFRYGWSAHEVRDVACALGFAKGAQMPEEADFRRYWITRGLRFAGRKTKRANAPLAGLVNYVSVRDPDGVGGVVAWRLAAHTKKN